MHWQPLYFGSLVAAIVLSAVGYFGTLLYWRWWVARSWKRRQAKRLPPSKTKFDRFHILCIIGAAGWSSLVARRAHNPKVAGSNPAPATRQNKGESVTYWFAFFVSILPKFLCDRFVTYV